MTIMDPSVQMDDPEAGGVEVDLNGSQDTLDTVSQSSADAQVPEPDDWSESQGEDEVRPKSMDPWSTDTLY